MHINTHEFLYEVEKGVYTSSSGIILPQLSTRKPLIEPFPLRGLGCFPFCTHCGSIKIIHIASKCYILKWLVKDETEFNIILFKSSCLMEVNWINSHSFRRIDCSRRLHLPSKRQLTSSNAVSGRRVISWVANLLIRVNTDSIPSPDVDSWWAIENMLLVMVSKRRWWFGPICDVSRKAAVISRSMNDSWRAIFVFTCQMKRDKRWVWFQIALLGWKKGHKILIKLVYSYFVAPPFQVKTI